MYLIKPLKRKYREIYQYVKEDKRKEIRNIICTYLELILLNCPTKPNTIYSYRLLQSFNYFTEYFKVKEGIKEDIASPLCESFETPDKFFKLIGDISDYVFPIGNYYIEQKKLLLALREFRLFGYSEIYKELHPDFHFFKPEIINDLTYMRYVQLYVSLLAGKYEKSDKIFQSIISEIEYLYNKDKTQFQYIYFLDMMSKMFQKTISEVKVSSKFKIYVHKLNIRTIDTIYRNLDIENAPDSYSKLLSDYFHLTSV